MRTFLLVLFLVLFPLSVRANNVILMIGDGMGENHIKCVAKDKPLFLTTLPIKGSVHTRSSDAEITDSAASATAYACGKRTNNYFLGRLPDGKDCLTIAEEAVQKGYAVGIYSNDESTGATPSAFYAHANNRNDKEKIQADREKASEVMDIALSVEKISDEVTPRLQKLLIQAGSKGFFAMFEGSKIDKKSHNNDYEGMKKELHDFDKAVRLAKKFIKQNPNTTLIVLADHETGGLTGDCQYTTGQHTGKDIPLYADGKYAYLFKGEQDNTEIYTKIRRILFPKRRLSGLGK